MFRCPLCSGVVPPRTPAQRVVLERRPRSYPYRPRANLLVRKKDDNKGKKKKKEYIDDPGGSGLEVVREALVCPDCARERGAG